MILLLFDIFHVLLLTPRVGSIIVYKYNIINSITSTDFFKKDEETGYMILKMFNALNLHPLIILPLLPTY